MGEPGIRTMHASLNVSVRAADRLADIQAAWTNSTSPRTHMQLRSHTKANALVNGGVTQSSLSDGCAQSPPEKLPCVPSSPDWQQLQFVAEKHVMYFLQCLRSLPSYSAADSSR